MIRLLLVVFSAAALSNGQTVRLTGPVQLVPGQTVTYTITFAPGPVPVSAFYWESAAQPWTGLLANKQVSCNPATLRCVLYGPDNAVPIVAGQVATVQYVVPDPAPAKVELTALLASQPDGSAAPLTMGVLLGDVNGDGELSIADVAAVVNQILGFQPCTSGDQNGDGVCNVRDVQITVNEVVKARG